MDYAHARHAGNMGDVLKHVALTAVLRELVPLPEPLLYLESHAGDGLYALATVGEWGEGISRLWDVPPHADGAGPLSLYRSLVGRFSPEGSSRPRAYPGSPVLAQAILQKAARPRDELALFEIDPQATRLLRASLGADDRVRIHSEEGLAGTARRLAQDASQRAVLLIDPPYSDKAEWNEVARLLPRLFADRPQATLLLWYPIKAMTRPVTLLNALAEGGVHGTAVEVVATPLRLKREKLNGAGIVLVRPPGRSLSALCADLPELARRLATRGESTARVFGF